MVSGEQVAGITALTLAEHLVHCVRDMCISYQTQNQSLATMSIASIEHFNKDI